MNMRIFQIFSNDAILRLENKKSKDFYLLFRWNINKGKTMIDEVFDIHSQRNEEIKSKQKVKFDDSWDLRSEISSININSFSKDLESARRNPPKHAHSKFVKVAPELKEDKFQKLNTLRMNKIEYLMSEEYSVHGVKAFDLHLLNMKQ